MLLLKTNYVIFLPRPLHIAIAQNNHGLIAYLVQLMSMAGLTVDIYNNLKQVRGTYHICSNLSTSSIRRLYNSGAYFKRGRAFLVMICLFSSVAIWWLQNFIFSNLPLFSSGSITHPS